MTFRLRLFITSGIALSSLGLAAAAFAGNHSVQIAGQLVSPSQVSAAQLRAGTPPSARLVQIGGSLVQPSKVSAFQTQLSRRASSPTVGDTSSSGWRSTGIVFAAVAVVALALVGTTQSRRRIRTAPA